MSLWLHAELCVLPLSASIRPHILTGQGESTEPPRAARAGAAWVSQAGTALPAGHGVTEPELPSVCSQRVLGTESSTCGVKQMKGPCRTALSPPGSSAVPSWQGAVRGCRRAEAGDPTGSAPALQEIHARTAGSIFILLLPD